ncbi:hydroxymethylglutaryl-CoA reductase (NADPH) [Paragonimus westermani]|uniref:3-hydroxy-3-methylglutaryl-coenzyme A reductase n=1 Tax=Paragonimus westermani TaxID=34504 RepID=A0A5J4NPK6_9TREM|nr:hydroxymethylglutaryl-CoA reductase (NADPH) [Paragonimus westermani]
MSLQKVVMCLRVLVLNTICRLGPKVPSPNVSDKELLSRLAVGILKTRELESVTSNPTKAVELRRMDLCRLLSNPHVLERLPFRDYDYRFVNGQCCEEVIGYLPLPVGKVGPLLLDGHSHYIPLATTEGCLVASTNRGCRALFLAGGVNSVVFRDQMTRAPVVWFPSVLQVVECIAWIESAVGYQSLKTVFNRTSAHINLISVFPNPSGHYLHIRFAASTGDAMGMNMVSKATNSALHELQNHFPQMKVISLSGNMCTDKKPSAINTILGRGKSVLAEACLPATVLAQVLHTSASRLSRLAHAKNWIGSAMAGCPGMTGANAHAANIVAGIFAATGQDLAQVVDSSACLTQFEVGENDSLIATVTMPCLEVGTIGGGTRLPAQRACLDLMDLNVDCPTEHLSRLITGTVLAGELSLMAALDTDDLVSAHLRLNRATVTPSSPTLPVTSDEVVSRAATHLNGILAKSDASGRLEPPHPIM